MPLLNEPLFLPKFFTPGEYRIEQARSIAQQAGCFLLRREVFCAEQGIFKTDDRDEIDDHAIHLAASTCMFGHCDEIIGTVRIHEPEPGLWWGSRLAVAKPHRRIGGLGPALIKLAVRTARFHGASIFLAHVQAQNRVLFESLDWQVQDSKTIHGIAHYLMQADLTAYAPIDGTVIRVLPNVKHA